MMHPLDKGLPWERAITVAGLITVSGLAWLYVIHLSASGSGGMAGMSMGGDAGLDTDAMTAMLPNVRPWQAMDAVLTLAMWAVMMVAMMTPSAAPMVLAFGKLVPVRGARAAAASGAFLLGYLIVWTCFSAGATSLQWALHTAGSLSPTAMRVTPGAGGFVLVLAGVYQLTPWKDVCLSTCRSPVNFLMAEWRDGARGALVMGLRHGSYCVGCCWSLMLVLFAAGVMNLLWVALIAAYVLIEKALPAGRWLSRSIGLLLIASGIWFVVLP